MKDVLAESIIISLIALQPKKAEITVDYNLITPSLAKCVTCMGACKGGCLHSCKGGGKSGKKGR
ncbi:MAG: hypothetical protein LBT04_00240 [Prevotellaceae bacterium]|jgi:hypothetical protein|nr:hypothetical protein [Prevotellaceae bacterium]